MKPMIRILVASIVVALSVAPAVAEIYLFIESPPITGDATTTGYENQINIVSLNTGGTNPGCTGASGSVQLSEATFTKELDSSSVDLLAALQNRTALTPAVFSMVTVGQFGFQEYQSFRFDDALLTSYGTSNDGDPGLVPLEVWTLSFSAVTVTHTAFDMQGDPVSTESVTLTPSSCVGN